jgi:transposase
LHRIHTLRAALREVLLALSFFRSFVFCFRGRRGDLLKVIWHDGQAASLYVRRLEKGRFLWPSPADGVVAITPAQMGYLLSGNRIITVPIIPHQRKVPSEHRLHWQGWLGGLTATRRGAIGAVPWGR